MNIKDITWNEVNRFSQLTAIVLFVGIFALGFYLGKTFEFHAFINAQKAEKAQGPTGLFNDVVYSCDGDSIIEAVYQKDQVDIFLPEKRHFTLPQVISASGARYATADESVVFWNKGETASITEGKKTTFANCVVKPMPQ